MKKILLLCLAAMLVLAFTLPAAAKTTFTASGWIKMGGYYLSNPTATASAGTAVSSAFMTSDLQLNFKYQINPKVWANVQFRGVNRAWGGSTMFNNYLAADIGFDAIEVEVANIFILAYKGWILVGRGKDGSTGTIGPLLASKVDSNRNWDSNDDMYDRIMVSQTFGPWSLFFLYQKITEGTMYSGVGDNDLDGYMPEINYTWKTGSIKVGDWMSRYRAPTYDLNAHKIYINAWQKFGPIAIGGRFAYETAKMRTAADAFATEASTSGWHLMGTAEYATGPYKVGVQFAVVDGVASSKDRIVGGPGTDYRGLYAAFGPRDGLMYDDSKYISPATQVFPGGATSDYKTTGDGGAGIQLYYGFFDYKLMEKMWVHAALGFIRWDEIPAAVAGVSTASNNYGSEFDLGAKYNISKGFDLGVHFGYFIPGDWFAAGVKGNHLHLDAELVMKF